MSQAPTKCARLTDEPEPTWEIARLFPPQGQWSEGEYLALDGNRLVELSNGNLEVLPIPTTTHQRIVAYLYGVLLAFANAHDLGEVLIAALPVRLWRENSASRMSSSCGRNTPTASATSSGRERTSSWKS